MTTTARTALIAWQHDIEKNSLTSDPILESLLKPHVTADFYQTLIHWAARIPTEIDPLVRENNERYNWPRLASDDAIGRPIERVIHHPTYTLIGDAIYGTGLLRHLATPGGLFNAISLFFLSSYLGEAGHLCPIACSAGIIRVLSTVDNVPNAHAWIDALCRPSFSDNITGAQFLTEIQGGSDVGANAVRAVQDEQGEWCIYGDKWFCSNANADVFLLTARVDDTRAGTKGLGLFLVSSHETDGSPNGFHIRRLKEKIGTNSMASGEITFNGARAQLVGKSEEGFKLVVENVLHLSRIFNIFCVLGMARRAYTIAHAYATHREAFGHAIIEYPMISDNLATIQAENTAMLAGSLHLVRLQDAEDLQPSKERALLLRLLVNMMKYRSAKWSVEHIHHSLDVLGGNGAIETFSILPRLLRDSIVCENWEGTHNVLCMQILRDMQKYPLIALFEKHLRTLTADAALLSQLAEAVHVAEQLLRDDERTQWRQIPVVVNVLSAVYCEVCYRSSCS